MSIKRVATILLILISLSAVATYTAVRSTLAPLDESARAQAPGSFVELADGHVHYAWTSGPPSEADAPPVVMVHGFSTPSFVWAGLLEPFARAGRRVLVYDNYGRGFSDRPNVANDAALFDRQLLQLLASQGVDRPVDLVGYSMGGAIATYFTAHHPEKVRRLGLIAPAGLPMDAGPFAKLVTAPIVGDWLMAVFGRRMLLTAMAAPENQGGAIPDIARRYEVQMRYEGYLRSLLSTLRHFPMGKMANEYEQVGAAKVPVLAIWGDRDAIVPPENAGRLATRVPNAKIEIIAGGTHAITYSEPDRVSAALISFFEGR